MLCDSSKNERSILTVEKCKTVSHADGRIEILCRYIGKDIGFNSLYGKSFLFRCFIYFLYVITEIIYPGYRDVSSPQLKRMPPISAHQIEDLAARVQTSNFLNKIHLRFG